MPIGPSHSGRGGSGSDGNGRSSGGNLFGAILGGVIGGALTAGARRRRRERYYDRHHHHDHYDHDDYNDYDEPSTPSRRRPTRWLVLAIVFAFITFFTIAVRNGFIDNYEDSSIYAANMVEDHKEWKQHYEAAKQQQQAIDNATGTEKQELIKTQTHFLTTATFYNVEKTVYGDNPQGTYYYKYNTINDYVYYFIVYEYDYGYYNKSGNYVTNVDKINVPKKKGRTYAHYTANNRPNGEIEIIYFIDTDGTMYSTDIFFIENELNPERGEYCFKLAKAEANKILAKNTIFVIIGEVLIAALFVFIYIKKLKKYKNLVQQDEEAYTQKQQAEVSEAQAKAEVAQKEAQQKNRICAFCGSTVPDDEPNCPSCGSSTFE